VGAEDLRGERSADTLKGRELIRATVGSSSGIMVSESHCRIPIASSIELMRAKRSSSER
jgi:hypothetical protein